MEVWYPCSFMDMVLGIDMSVHFWDKLQVSLAGLLCPYFLIRCFTLLRHTEFAKLGCLMVESSGASEDSLDITTVGDREGYFDNLREIYHQLTLVMTSFQGF